MSVKTLMQYLEKRSSVTLVTPEKDMGLQPEPAWIGRVPLVTPVTPHLSDTRKNMRVGQLGEAVNDPVGHDLQSPPEWVQDQAPAPDKPVKQTFVQQADTWRHLDRAYQAHHFNCPVCIASGLGYGLRCGTGAALWTAYSDAL